MKKYIAIALAFIVAVGVFVYSFSYRDKKNSSTVTLPNTTVSSNSSNGESDSQKSIIAQNEEGGYTLYYKNGTPTLSYGDTSLEFPGWARSINLETPTLYCNDFDGDGENELIVRLADNFSQADPDGRYSYTLYMFKPNETENGTQLAFITAQSSTWKNVFNNSIKMEVTQLKAYEKILQFALNDIKTPINYDSSTGLTDNEYVAFARADYKTKGNYYTVGKYARGLGIYTIKDDGTIELDIEVVVNYKQTGSLNFRVGSIKCEMEIRDNAFKIKPNSIHFVPDEDRIVFDPRDNNVRSWFATVLNQSAEANKGDIEKFDAEFNIEGGQTINTSFSNYNDDMRRVRKIDVGAKQITFFANDGYIFSSANISEGLFAVYVNGIDISYKAKVVDSTLTITFDRLYSPEDLSTIRVTFGE